MGETIHGKSWSTKFKLIFCKPEKTYVHARMSRAIFTVPRRPSTSPLSQENTASVASRKLYWKIHGCQRVWSKRQKAPMIARNTAMNHCGFGATRIAAASKNSAENRL